MRWKTGRRSDNVEDRRGSRAVRGAAGGGLGILVIALIAMLFGADPFEVIQQMSLETETSAPSGNAPGTRPTDEGGDFVSVVLADTEDTWHELFRQMGKTYNEPKLVLFSDAVKSACGFAQAATGPFYCPGDHKVYIDLSFYKALKEKFKAPGDFAEAYVIAHEVGHHVQTLLGILQKVHAARSQMSEADGNDLLVRLELQADCFAGVWANHADKARHVLESGDIEEALNAAASIGDDRLQKQSRGYVTPETFTHGTSAQRVRWFRRGFEKGTPDVCNTYQARDL